MLEGNLLPPKADDNKKSRDLPEIYQKDLVERPTPLLNAAIRNTVVVVVTALKNFKDKLTVSTVKYNLHF